MDSKEVFEWLKNNENLFKHYLCVFFRQKNAKLDYNEVYNQAVLALVRAGKYYNPAKGKFGTLACTCIARELFRYNRYNLLKLSYPCRILDRTSEFNIVRDVEKEKIVSVQDAEFHGNTKGLSFDAHNDEALDKKSEFIKRRRIAKQIFNSLPIRSKKIIMGLYNMETLQRNKSITPDLIARQLNISPQAVRQCHDRYINRVKLYISSYIKTTGEI